jgi:hypothetical protein
MSDLKACPCGKLPAELHISENGQGGKWMNVAGSCCDEWMIEFRTRYNAIDSDECMKLAVEAWNDAKRGEDK